MKFINYLLCCVVALAITGSISAQSTATIEEDYTTTLDVNEPLDTDYVADISNLNITDQNEFQSFFNMMNDMAIKFTVDFGAETVSIQIVNPDPMGGSGMTVAEWNQHLAKKVTRTKMALQMN